MTRESTTHWKCPSCGHSVKRGSRSPAVEGAVRPGGGGYLREFDGERWVLQHRLVWEREHGKKLGKRVVHHVNGDPQDNRIENLKAMSASDHSKLHAEERRRANGGRPKRKLVNFRLPVDLCGAIMRAAEEEGISQTAWVEQALREALALEPGEPVERSEEPQDEVVAVVVSSPAAPEPGDFSPRDGWVEARMKELEHSVPSAAARRALALREWRANGG